MAFYVMQWLRVGKRYPVFDADDFQPPIEWDGLGAVGGVLNGIRASSREVGVVSSWFARVDNDLLWRCVLRRMIRSEPVSGSFVPGCISSRPLLEQPG